MPEIHNFLKLMHDQGASDLHLSSGNQPALRLYGDIKRIKYEVLTHDRLKTLLYEITPPDKIKEFEQSHDIDFGYEIQGAGRYRANFFMQRNGISAVFRLIPTEIPTVRQLELPPVIAGLSELPEGLVLVSGPTGSGKTTTLAAVIDQANKIRKDHIITIEDPIEFVHQSQNCIVNQREAGRHTKNFASALRGALREDPDIIMVGELRDLETISLACEAASTGHLVFGTLHTASTSKTVDRIIEVFPPSGQAQIRSVLADSLRAVIAQTLFKRIDKQGRCAAFEILTATPAVKNLIRESKTHQIASMIQTGKQYGMQLLDDDIMNLYKKGRISQNEAYNKADNKNLFRPFLKNTLQNGK